jgi:hypothetical protein
LAPGLPAGFVVFRADAADAVLPASFAPRAADGAPVSATPVTPVGGVVGSIAMA